MLSLFEDWQDEGTHGATRPMEKERGLWLRWALMLACGVGFVNLLGWLASKLLHYGLVLWPKLPVAMQFVCVALGIGVWFVAACGAIIACVAIAVYLRLR